MRYLAVKMLLSIYNVSYKQQCLQLCPKGRETTVKTFATQWASLADCVKQMMPLITFLLIHTY